MNNINRRTKHINNKPAFTKPWSLVYAEGRYHFLVPVNINEECSNFSPLFPCLCKFLNEPRNHTIVEAEDINVSLIS